MENDPGSALAWMLPFLIFLARIADVSLGTLRMNFVARGLKARAMIAGFFEVLIWVTIISQVVRDLNHWIRFVAYAGGYSAGTYIGMLIEERLAIGTALIRVIPQRDAERLVARLRADGYGVTRVPGEGAAGPVSVLFTMVPRARIPDVLRTIRKFNPRAFFTIEDVRRFGHGIQPGRPAPPAPRAGK